VAAANNSQQNMAGRRVTRVPADPNARRAQRPGLLPESRRAIAGHGARMVPWKFSPGMLAEAVAPPCASQDQALGEDPPEGSASGSAGTATGWED